MLAVTSLLAATALATTVHKTFKGSPPISAYAYSNAACTIKANPINVIFYGKHASATAVANNLVGGKAGTAHFKKGTRGDRFPGGDTEYIRVRGQCLKQQRQLATHSDSSSLQRYHVRLFGLRKTDGTYLRGNNGLIFTVGDAHLEDRFPSSGSYNSAVTQNGYNKGRLGVRHAWLFNGGVAPASAKFYRGNTAVIPQGNGNTPKSDGYIVELKGNGIN